MLEVSAQRGDENCVGNLSGRVQAACPEYAKHITNWKHLENIFTRIAPRALRALEQGMSKAGLPFHILPQTWLREAWMLLAPS